MVLWPDHSGHIQETHDDAHTREQARDTNYERNQIAWQSLAETEVLVRLICNRRDLLCTSEFLAYVLLFIGSGGIVVPHDVKGPLVSCPAYIEMHTPESHPD